VEGVEGVEGRIQLAVEKVNLRLQKKKASYNSWSELKPNPPPSTLHTLSHTYPTSILTY